MPAAPQHLFVYGALRRQAGHPMFRRMVRHAVPLGAATWRGRLYRIAWYPGAVPSENPADTVVGEIYRLRSPRLILPTLDRFENCFSGQRQPTEFRREEHAVRLADGTDISAWVYVYNRAVAERRRIASGDFLAPR